jgi:hypothetical protein
VLAVTRVRAVDKRVPVEALEKAVRRLPAGHLSGFEFQARLLETLNALDGERAPAPPERQGIIWNVRTGLPRVRDGHSRRRGCEKKTDARRQKLAALRNETAWEPTRMVAFAHELAHPKRSSNGPCGSTNTCFSGRQNRSKFPTVSAP